MFGTSLMALIGLGLALGLRHGIDWDHIAAITDLTGSVVTTDEQAAVIIAPGSAAVLARAGSTTQQMSIGRRGKLNEARDGMFLATLYALGHAFVVVMLGLLAIWVGTILPAWIDPVMERVVGITLLGLGVWIFYSIWRYGRSFRLQSRWMLVFSLIARGWTYVRTATTRHPIEHSHKDTQYGPKTAFSIGLIHGVGAETGSQALLLASAAGATTPETGTLLLLSFVVGLVISNSLIAAFSTLGFVSSSTKRIIYLGIGIFSGVFSMVVGALFVLGQGAKLPDLQSVLNYLLGLVR